MDLMIDIETYSSVDIGKAGSYKYAQSEDFEILLFAYKYDNLPTCVIDLAQGEEVPEHVIKALMDPLVIKHAYNAAFEIYCLNQAGYYTNADQWRCTMVHGMYAGYPAGLAAIGKAIGLPEEKQKLAAGKALIRYFCQPCKPTKRNGGRTRNLPHHDPDKWELFKKYNEQDVETEYAIEQILSDIPMPDSEIAVWHEDIRMNTYGVKVDRKLVAGALAIDEAEKEHLLARAKMLTGLDNPSSNVQVLGWLQRNLPDHGVQNVTKATVAELLETDLPGNVRDFLEVRQMLAKTSVTKYDAMARSMSDKDDRVRGLLQYYGASRTGRYCLTGDHEVLTPKGWVRLDEWDGGYIACWTPAGELVSFQKAEALSFPYEGPMYHYRDKRIDQISTPDHKMYFKPRYGGKWEIDTVENMAECGKPCIPFTGYRNTVTQRSDPDKLRVLVMTQADGHYTEDNCLNFNFKKLRKVERCKRLLRRAGIAFQHSVYGNDIHKIHIPRRTMPIWLRQFREKVFDWWMLDEDPAIIFEELEFWDGYRAGPNSLQYTSTTEQNVDVIQALAHVNGMTARKKIKKRSKQHPNWSDAYICDIWLTPINCHEIRNKPEITDFKGTVYCAKTKTGFFLVRRGEAVWVTGNSGRLVQVQNLPRNYLSTLGEARQLVRDGNGEAVKMIYGDVADTLSQLIRTAFIPADGKKFIVSDFSAIEARVIAWLAGEEWVNEVFRTTGRIYEATAARMFHVEEDLIRKGNPEYALRQKGKIATLALGYQGGPGALIAMGADKMGIPEEDLGEIVQLWRKANPNIVRMWYEFQECAEAVIYQGGSREAHGIVFSLEAACGTRFMSIRLPSGRKLYYNSPYLDNGHICHFGQNQTTKRWEVTETYGGKLAENIVQATARDCLVVALMRLIDQGYVPVMHIHDEIVIEADPTDHLEDVNQIFAEPIPWAPGLVLTAAGFEANYYMKD